MQSVKLRILYKTQNYKLDFIDSSADKYNIFPKADLNFNVNQWAGTANINLCWIWWKVT